MKRTVCNLLTIFPSASLITFFPQTFQNKYFLPNPQEVESHEAKRSRKILHFLLYSFLPKTYFKLLTKLKKSTALEIES